MPHKTVKSNDYPIAKKVRVEGDYLALQLTDGRKFDVPLKWFPSLRHAPTEARKVVRNDVVGVRWPILGFELGVGGLVRECLRKKACRR
jgi:hypothetical protein